MNATSLEFPDHAPEPRDLAGIARELHTGFDGMDDMSEFAASPEMRNTLIRAAFVASQRRFDSRFGDLT